MMTVLEALEYANAAECESMLVDHHEKATAPVSTARRRVRRANRDC